MGYPWRPMGYLLQLKIYRTPPMTTRRPIIALGRPCTTVGDLLTPMDAEGRYMDAPKTPRRLINAYRRPHGPVRAHRRPSNTLHDSWALTDHAWTPMEDLWVPARDPWTLTRAHRRPIGLHGSLKNFHGSYVGVHWRPGVFHRCPLGVDASLLMTVSWASFGLLYVQPMGSH